VTIRSPGGPIPASAGEPDEEGLLAAAERAYPRERGGTLLPARVLVVWGGLSPRARGNRLCSPRSPVWPGPIPASAGEPRWRTPRRRDAGAYPRERGGTSAPPGCSPRSPGLSPRARGNRQVIVLGEVPQGPIPASAGEPVAAKGGIEPERAYPRERGGTTLQDFRNKDSWGLSPRARGNRTRTGRGRSGAGPIPASAGEPRRAASWQTDRGAYPRERGGTGL